MKNMVDELLAKCEDCEKKDTCPGYQYGLDMKNKGVVVTEEQFDESKTHMAIESMLDMLDEVLGNKQHTKRPPVDNDPVRNIINKFLKSQLGDKPSVQHVVISINTGGHNSDGALN